MGTNTGKDDPGEHEPELGDVAPAHKVGKQIRLTRGQWDRLAKEAAAERTTVSEYLRQIVDIHLLRKSETERTHARLRALETRVAKMDERLSKYEAKEKQPGE